MQPEDYIVVHFIKPPPLGLRFKKGRNDWPLHMTLAPWFRVADRGRLQVSLEEVAEAFAAIRALVGGEESFGPDHDIPVNSIADYEDIRPLHRAIVAAARVRNGEFLQERWLGDDYRPHVTHHTGERCQEGDAFLFDDFHLVRLLAGNTCQVAQRFILSGDKTR